MVKHQSHLRFVFWAMLVLYLVLLLCEYLRPGFVSTGMNPHVLLLVLFAFSPFLSVAPSRPDHYTLRVTPYTLAILGIVLALIVWHIGGDFGVMRFWIAIAVGVSPMLFILAPRA